MNSLPQKNAVPKFYCLRIVRIVSGKYITCSCGLPSRMRLLCRHTIYVTGGYSIEMFALRYLVIYQHVYEKPGYEAFSDIFREMEHEKYGRNNGIGETLKISTWNLPSNKDIRYPKNINELTNDEDVVNINNMMEAKKKGIVLVRGYSIEEQMRTT